MDRVRVYVDGFNLYFGLRAKHGRRLHWLDLEKLATSLLKPSQRLERVVYFTARVRNDPPAEQRQSDYIDALTAHCSRLTLLDGRYQAKTRHCRACGSRWTVYEEKETDVNIAVSLIEDAVTDRFDMALLVSADSDLCPAVKALKRLRPDKRIIAAFPPSRSSGELRRVVDGAFTIGDAKLRQSQLPDAVTTPAGIVLRRPARWS
ncbi:uncharacterized LabA/DUF88 family protein [Herbihabitans rhizosphaerae]|uniref:Uncharacterized LabA/DUF88 family protein n=1 Tax=Herbihabitans rhizosphaerae TaxID=1872711 RepID=A0A4Q7L663_9PSEU|nr:NYN domain-containing protein [Herbihabitans rhizosphaerae]RZS44825.1 uncharacterized LabA/DUF88 family protein [Herbihabitans rhizosphaerae]